MSTPHNAANSGDIAQTVLLPGDPLRAKVISERFLKDAVQFNSVRNMYLCYGDRYGYAFDRDLCL